MLLIFDCANTGFCTDLLFDAVAWVAACTNLLHDLTHWQVVCATGGAMRLGDTRISQGAKQEP
jgi:hypothetical protein